MNYEEALEQSLVLAADQEALDAFLAGVPEWEPRLRAALRVMQALEANAATILPSTPAVDRIEGQVLKAVRAQAKRDSGRDMPGRLAAAWNLLPGPRLIVAAGSLGLTLAIASLIALPLFQGSPSAQAVVIRGSLSEVGPGVLTVNEQGQASMVKLSTSAQLTDGVGNTVAETVLSPGQSIVLRGTRVGDEVIAESLEIEDHIFGVVQSISPDLLVLMTSQGVYEVILTADTETEGNIVPGAYVVVEVEVRSDGRFVAHEIEVEDEAEESEDGDDDSSTRGIDAPSSGVQPTAGNGQASPASGTLPALTSDTGANERENSDPIGGLVTPAPGPSTHASPSPQEEAEDSETPELLESPETPEPTEPPEPTELPEVHEGEEEDHPEDAGKDEPGPEAEDDEDEGEAESGNP